MMMSYYQGSDSLSFVREATCSTLWFSHHTSHPRSYTKEFGSHPLISWPSHQMQKMSLIGQILSSREKNLDSHFLQIYIMDLVLIVYVLFLNLSSTFRCKILALEIFETIAQFMETIHILPIHSIAFVFLLLRIMNTQNVNTHKQSLSFVFKLLLLFLKISVSWYANS